MSRNKKQHSTKSSMASYVSDDEEKVKIIDHNGKKKVDSNLISELESITGLSKQEAKELLEACNNDISMAINLHIGTDNMHRSWSKNIKITSSTTTTSKAAKPVIDDNVRAPIPQKSEKLLDYDPYSLVKPNNKRSRSAFDNYRDLDDYDESSSTSSLFANMSKKRTLEELFRRPIDILFSGSFETAKLIGTNSSRWILLNLQNLELFECQCLNRDLWKDETVKEIVEANFIFLQINNDTPDGQKLINYYKVVDYPYISIIDPRTGEQMKHWSKLDSAVFCEVVTNFLSDHELPVTNESKTISPSISRQKTNNASTDDELTGYKNLNLSGNSNKRVKLNTFEATKEVLTVFSDSSSEQKEKDEDVLQHKIISTPKKHISNILTDKKDEVKTNDTSLRLLSTNGPNVIKYETQKHNIDCCLRIMFPNCSRLDFHTNGDSSFKLLISYLNEEGYNTPKYELIERLLGPQAKEQQSRNLFNLNKESTFKELNLYPRVFLLMQES